MSFYGDDLAFIHDEGFTGYARQAGAGVLSLLGEHGIEDGVVVDLGCGSGVWGAQLVRSGYEVVGVDVSGALLDLARSRTPEGSGARWIQGSLFDFEFPSCRAVTSLGECFNYGNATGSAAGDLLRLFGRIHTALEPGGVLVFDVAIPGRGGFGTQRKFIEAEDWTILLETHEDREAATLERRITSFRRSGELFRRDRERHLLHLFEPDFLLGLLCEAGFEARRIAAYNEMELPPGYAAFVARR